MNQPDFWTDLERSQKVNQEMKALKNKVESWKKTKARIEDAEVLIELGQEMEDESVVQEVQKEISQLEKEVERMRLATLLKGQYDSHNAIISLHAGAGGTEAMDWAGMLLRMYTRWCENNGYEVKTLDLLPGEEAGIKSATLHVIGENAYGYLKQKKECTAWSEFLPLMRQAGAIPPLLPWMLCLSWRMIMTSKSGRKNLRSIPSAPAGPAASMSTRLSLPSALPTCLPA